MELNNNLGIFKSSGRMYKENIEYDFLEDKFRIINSKAFRRLEYKTQVFINYTGDHYRTRLTHSLEVSQVTVYLARKLSLNEELTEAIALSHDLGHPPFGHAGEEALNVVAHKFGGFDHNVQGINIITTLERQFPKFNGLNLTIETIDGILKHNGPINNVSRSYKLKRLLGSHSIDFASNASLESQIASLADDIAYFKHDIDDGIRAGFIFLEKFCAIEMFNYIYKKIVMENLNINKEALKREVLRKFGIFLIKDLIEQTKKNIRDFNINSAGEVTTSKKLIAEFSKPVEIELKELKKFLFDNVYCNFKVNRVNFKAKKIIQDLFAHFMNYPVSLPESWQKDVDLKKDQEVAVQVINYIAGMTDRFAVIEHKKIFDIYHY